LSAPYKRVKMLVICGSGIASANMMAGRIQVLAEELGVRVETKTSRIHDLATDIMVRKPDVLVYSAFIPDRTLKRQIGDLPSFDGTVFLGGRSSEALGGKSEKEVLMEIFDALKVEYKKR